MGKRYCRVCDAESDLCYKCHRCGKPFHGDGGSSGGQQLRPDGGSADLEGLSTHDLVGMALGEHDDQEAKDGIPTADVVDWIVSRTELVRADVHDAIDWLHSRGHVYEPRPDYLRRTDADSGRWLAVAWHEALVEVRVKAGDLDPRYLTDRYGAETPTEVDELVQQAVKEVIRGGNEKLTLDDVDAAEEKLEEAGYEAVTDGGTVPGESNRDHIYVGRIPGTRKWNTDYETIAEWAGGEENVSIMHKRGREYVLDLSVDHPRECSMNRRYDCGHVAFGPPRRLPSKCPECKPVATDGGTASSDTGATRRSMLDTSAFLGTQQYEEPSEIQQRIGYTNPPTHVSLFSGIGGFDLGFARAGFKNLVAVEADEHAADTFRRNLVDGDHLDQDEPPVLMERDITKVATWEILEAAGIGVGQLTAVSGGPPCQGFSHIGKREEDDPRNELYLEMVRIVHQAKPVFFVMENVPGLATMHDGEAIMEICENFAAGGYEVTWEKVDAADYGVPQHRERVIVIGKRVDVMGMPEEGNPQLHIGAKPGQIEHPEFFRDRHDLNDPDQATLDAFGDDPETLDGIIEQILQEGMTA